MSIVSYAQNFEDVLLWRALGHIAKGFYIDVGAQHPVIDSVSKAFYEHGWRGIHAEPVPEYAELLRTDRPDELVIQAAIADKPGLLRFYDIVETGLSTADAAIAEHHRAQGWAMREISVTTITLDDVFTHVQTDLHWLKIDVEGFERNVLLGWNSPPRPWVVIIESTYPNSQKPTFADWEPLILDKGYRLVHEDGLNRYYLHAQHEELAAAFRVGPNVFDGFQLAETHWAVASMRNHYQARLQALDQDKQVLQCAMAECQQRFERERAQLIEQANQKRAELATRLQAAQTQLLDRERELATQLEQLRTSAQAQAEALRQEHAAREAVLREELSAARQALEQEQRALQALEEEARRERIELSAQAAQERAELQARLEAAHAKRLERERELAAQLEQLRTTAQAQAEALRQEHAAREAVLREELTAAMQAQVDALHQHAHHALALIQQELAQHIQYAQALRAHIDAMQSTWWWRFSQLFRQPGRWSPLPAPPASVLAPPYDVEALLPTAVAAIEPLAGDAQAASATPLPDSVSTQPAAAADASTAPRTLEDSQEIGFMPISHITELFCLDGREFITAAYQNLLGREPDSQGITYYLGRLALGYSKESIVAQLAASPEVRGAEARLPGLKVLLKAQRRETHWFWGWFNQRQRQERVLRQHTQALLAISQRIDRSAAQWQSPVQKVANLPGRLATNLSPQSTTSHPQHLTADEVRAAFREILGRAPENDDVITHHAQLPSLQALRETLFNSEEYKSKAQGAYARLLLGRIVQAAAA